ncbi:MAG: hypothetical protein GKR94_21010 [Gammaproteobacteria bacterium]|nr:hypothetical protein [Gammaproteobacteria bacterium]
MMFIYADSLDYVDPGYDFLRDRNADGRRPYWDDRFPHEIMNPAPYDGVLVSRGIVGDHRFPGKYTESQAMRFRRVGAREFLRLNGNDHATMPIYGDCGAFSYHKEAVPPYSSEDMVEFYGDGGFTHGCSVEHVIFDFDPTAKGLNNAPDGAKDRFDITLSNAEAFLHESRVLGPNFTPLGVVQGWSPDSMASAAERLVGMGYEYLAVGGMVPLGMQSVALVLDTIQSRIPPRVRLHLLGFAKAESVSSFARFKNLYSFDSTSPLLRAFKDGKRNYFFQSQDGSLDYYTAIRIPQATGNPKLQRAVREGRLRQEDLIDAEKAALDAVRRYDAGGASLDEALDRILAYSTVQMGTGPQSGTNYGALEKLSQRYRRTLAEVPWKRCPCTICTTSGVEVVIFRASNRNKRRGIHNLFVYHSHLKRNGIPNA